MGSSRKILSGVLLLAVGALLWFVASRPSGSESDGAGMEGLSLLPEESLVEESPEPEQLPVQHVQREEAEPEVAAPELGPEVGPAKVVSHGIFGRVFRKGGDPVPGRKVELSFMGAMGGQVFTSATSDVDGNYTISFELDAFSRELRRSQLSVYEEWAEWAQEARASGDEQTLQALVHNRQNLNHSTWLELSVADANGFRARRRLDLRADMPDRVRIDLRLEEQRDLEGQILGPNGPVAAANIMLFDGEWGLERRVLSDAEGKFRMDGPPPGAFILHARLPGVGAGQTGGNFIGGAMRAPFQTIQLGGGMKLSGEVVNPDGEKIKGLPLIAIIDSLAQAAENPLWPLPRELAQAEALGALCFAETITDKDGGFVFTAMEAGHYQVRFKDLPEKYQPVRLFSTTGSQEVVFAGCLLEVELAGAVEDMVGVRVHCIEVIRGKDLPKTGKKHFMEESSFGFSRFLLEPGSTWEIHAERDGVLQPPIHKRIGEGQYLTKAVLNVRSWERRGRKAKASQPPVSGTTVLKVKLKGAKGKSYRGLATMHRIETSGESLQLESEPIPSGGFKGLERGQYRLSVESESGSTPFLPARQKGTLSLGSSRTKEVVLDVSPGSGVRLAITMPKDSKLTGVTAQLEPEGEGQEPIPLSFALVEGSPATPILPRDEGAHCTPIVPAGSYKLVVRGVGGTVTVPPQKVVLKAGEIKPITIIIP